ncbi:recombinase family protein [Neobacillus niacini]|uniref:recombinase family protein n=1 Tax=Neobacillus niacini TaxID=86668 RepID=UPI0028562748|nr:recombinase family protein [Neobacillus niacini]MDR7000420.1 DNA invertase Pin-like site-specific DNA recombinase [Neobacillus niacini]
MTTTTEIKNVGILLRISRDAGEGKNTLLSHRTIAERYCNERGYKYKIYEEIISGGKSIIERTELTNLLTDVMAGLWDAVFVVSTDRLSRKLGASQAIADTLAEYEIPLLTPERAYDLNSDDRLMFDFQGVIASQELMLITKRYKRGKREGVLRGEWIQGVTPYGYTRNPRTKKLVKVDEEAKVVRIIFDYALAGYGIHTIVNKLVGFRTRSYEVKGGKNAGTIHTGKPFGISHIDTILKNPVYKGTISYQPKNKQKKVIETIIVHDAHEGIVTPDEFQQVQEAVNSRISGGSEGLAKRTRSKGQVITILKDLVYCHCGLKMQFKKDSKQKNTVYLKGCQCGNKGVAEYKLLETFWDKLSNIERQFRKNWDKLLSDTNNANNNIEDLRNQLTKLVSQKNILNKALKNTRKNLNLGVITREEYLEYKEEFDRDLNDVNTAILGLEEQIELSNKDTLSKRYETKLKWLSDIRKLTHMNNGKLFVMGNDLKNAPKLKIETKDIEEVNRLLKLVLDKIHYRRDDKHTWIDEDGKVEGEKGPFIHLNIKTK